MWKRTIPKKTNMQKDNSEKQHNWKTTVPKRQHLTQDNSEQETSGQGQF